MDGWLKLIVASFALWRVSAWLYFEHGAQGIRERLCKSPFWGSQVCCFWCVTLWLSVPVALVAWLWWPALVPLALSGAVILLSGGGRILWHEMMSDE